MRVDHSALVLMTVTRQTRGVGGVSLDSGVCDLLDAVDQVEPGQHEYLGQRQRPQCRGDLARAQVTFQESVNLAGVRRLLSKIN